MPSGKPPSCMMQMVISFRNCPLPANRMSVSISKIPLNMQHAIVAIEDERFYEHNGIDIQGILRAFVNGVSHGFHFNEGASTLTQQLLKNNVFTNWTNEGKIERFKRKIQEQYLALQLEASLTAEGMDTKSVILENYLNTINLSAGTYGVQAAAQRYFGKNSEDLTLSECAVLAAIPQNPYAYNPIRFPEENAKRRKKVLTNMRNQGYISESEYQEALADNVYERIQETDSSQETATPYSYFIDELTSQIITDLQEQKAIQKYRHKMHFTVVVFGSIPHRIRQFSLSWMKNIKMKKTSRLIYSSVSTGP